ncbi:MAG: hypothetical protein HQM09_17515 [Candidatus Riflebacteria bacterium]|nr:hypothetical protein [Candidatus Riflebacteria bacterium]
MAKEFQSVIIRCPIEKMVSPVIRRPVVAYSRLAIKFALSGFGFCKIACKTIMRSFFPR